MIRAVFGRDRVTVMGHAGYAPKGQDIVCAAVSALVYALIGDLQERGLVRELVIRPGGGCRCFLCDHCCKAALRRTGTEFHEPGARSKMFPSYFLYRKNDKLRI